jgi:hypothetical protein
VIRVARPSNRVAGQALSFRVECTLQSRNSHVPILVGT